MVAGIVGRNHPRQQVAVRASAPGPRSNLRYALLTVGDDGRARSLQTRLLGGMEVSEGAAPIGVALETLDDAEGLIWVQVAVQ